MYKSPADFAKEVADNLRKMADCVEQRELDIVEIELLEVNTNDQTPYRFSWSPKISFNVLSEDTINLVRDFKRLINGSRS